MPLETIEDHHIKIKPTSKLINFLVKDIKNCRELPESITLLKSSYKNKRAEFCLTLNDIKWLKTYLSEQQNSFNGKVYIHELLEGSDVELPKPKITPRNPELDARVKKLQAQQDARDYKAMTKGVDSFRKHLPEDTIAFQSKIYYNFFYKLLP